MCHKLSIAITINDIDSNNPTLFKLAKNTWANIAALYNVPVYYFACINNNLDDTNIITLTNINDNSDNDYLKRYHGLKWLLDNSKSEFYMIANISNYIVIPTLLKLLNEQSDDMVYMGGHGLEQQISSSKVYFHSMSPGIVLSHKLLDKMYKVYTYDDWTSFCENSGNGYLTPAFDVAIGYMNHYLGVKPTKQKGFMHCNFKGQLNNKQCCKNIQPDQIISCNNMSAEHMNYYHQYLIGCYDNYKPNQNNDKIFDKCHELNKRWTIVTHIKTLENSWLLKIPLNIVIFCDESNSKSNSNVKIITKNSDLKIIDKFDMMKNAIDNNYFNNDMYCWLDVNYTIFLNNLITNLEEYREKASFCYVDHTSYDKIHNLNENDQPCIISNFFTGHKRYLSLIYEKYISMTSKHVSMTSNIRNKIITKIYYDNPEWFDIYFSNIEDIMSNYVTLQLNPNIDVIQKLLDDNQYYLCSLACEKVLSSYTVGDLKISADMLIKILDHYYTSEYWLGNKSKCIELLKLHSKFCLKYSNYNECLEKHGLIIKNSDFIYNDLPTMKNAMIKTDDVDDIQISELIDLDFRVFVYGNYQVTTKSLIINNPVIRPFNIKYDTNYTLEVD